jgi:NAD(P)-dependent dehydrogenase (short-subunit alcohol dehydrogenase family)
MYTYWLARELSETRVTANCIRVTNVKIDLERYPDLSRADRWAYALKSRSSISPEDMAATYTWLATSPEVTEVSGKYFNENNREVHSSRYSRQTEHIDQLMKLTMSYIK